MVSHKTLQNLTENKCDRSAMNLSLIRPWLKVNLFARRWCNASNVSEQKEIN